MLWKSTSLFLCGVCMTTLVNADNKITSSQFNPAISLILNGTYSQFSNNPENYTIAGFALAEETGPGEEGFSLGESELNLSSNIDDLFYGHLTVALTSEDSVEVEESYIETLGLGHGLTIKAGRFFSGIGYLNQQHAHSWDFVDQPLVYKAMLGNQLGDDGVQVRWLAPTDLYLELGIEALRGDGFPAGNGAKDGKGTTTVFAHMGGDINVSHSWRAGTSFIQAEAAARQTGDPAETFIGDSHIAAVDFVWKWSPNGNAKIQNLKIQGEYFVRSEKGTYESNAYDADQKGFYLQTIYQFMPSWRVGLRYDSLHADDPGAAFAGTALDNQGHDPQRWSMMFDWSRSEFSRLRLQYNRDEAGPDADNQLYLQYTMSLGAHGAHRF